MKKLSIFFSILIILALVLTGQPAKAAFGDIEMLEFFGCSNNNDVDTDIGEAQMQVWVKDLGVGLNGKNQVGFTFYNIGPDASSITAVYFDDGALLGIAVINPSDGVEFSQGATPGHLPSGNECVDPPFEVTEDFLADSDDPTQPNGVNESDPPPDPDTEWVEIIFDLKDSLRFENVMDQLRSGELRIGIKVQGYDSEGSESFINKPFTAVELMSFNALSRNGNVNVKWATGTELNNAGFNLYRASSELGARTKLNNGLVAAHGDAVSGGSYSFSDAPGYGTFYYWLEDVELGGTTTLHGPVVVTAWPSIRFPVIRPAVP